MLISKILEGTLTAGSTSISFTDSDIPNSFIRIGCTDPDLMPVSQSMSGNTLTITYEAQASNKGIVVDLVKAGISVINALDSTDENNALSAKQGNALNDALSNLTETVNNLNIPENITDLADVDVTSIQDGQVLAWDDDLQKFVNVEQSGGGSTISYSTSETLIGTWINGENLYQKTISCGNLPNNTSKTIAHGISNLDTVISAEGFAKSTANQTPIPFVNNTTVGSQVVLIIDNTNITLRTSDDRSVYNGYVTMRYTKTS